MKHNQRKRTEYYEKIKIRSNTEFHIITTKNIENIMTISKNYNMISTTIIQITENINHIINTYQIIEKKTLKFIFLIFKHIFKNFIFKNKQK